jgi:hypothetical protein
MLQSRTKTLLNLIDNRKKLVSKSWKTLYWDAESFAR